MCRILWARAWYFRFCHVNYFPRTYTQPDHPLRALSCSQLLMMKSTGIDLSGDKPMTGASKLSGAQLKFFCSQFGPMDQQQKELMESCSAESARMMDTFNRVCFEGDEKIVVGDVDIDVVNAITRKKCKKPTEPSVENCQEDRFAKINGVCRVKLIQDCTQKQYANCDIIKISVEICENINLFKDSSSVCYGRVQKACAARNDDGKYIAAIDTSRQFVMRPLIHRYIKDRPSSCTSPSRA